MGKEDTERQALNVYKMRLLGAKVHPVTSGTATLKDAVSETMREWTNRIADTHYVLGSVMGPHPFPTIVRDFQAVISKEIKEQMLEKEGRLPDAVLACVGGGSNAIGTFYHFINDPSVKLIGCEAAGRGVNTAETAATIATGRLGIFHGMKSYFCQDEYGQIAPVYSISAGLDYPGIGPEHAHLYDIGRAQYVPVTDEEAVQKHMQYVEFDYTTSSDSSDSSDKTVSDDKKKQVKEKAAAFAEGAKTAEDFASYATEQGTEAKDATFDSDSVSPSKEVVKAADKLGEGELTGVVESDTACYVAKVTSLNDEAATETKKQSLLTEKQDKYYKKVLKKWKKEEKITVHKGTWNKIDFTKLSVKAKDTSTTGTSTDSASGN